MIKFEYNKDTELMAFEKFLKIRKSKPVLNLVERELKEVPISKDNPIIIKQVELIEKLWREVADNFYKKIGEFYNIEAREPDLYCYLIRTSVYPYNYKDENKWFAA